MPDQFYFCFSEGSYSDYGINGLYVCDHNVTKEEWEAHYAAYLKELEKFPDAPSYRERETPEYAAYYADGGGCQIRQAWIEANDPEKSFQAKHNMVRIEYTELWRDY